MPYVEMTFAGRASGALLPPSSTQANTDGSSRCNAVATKETWVARPVRPACLNDLGLEPGQHEQRGVGDDGAGHDGEAADVRQGQAGQPRVARRVHSELRRGGPCRRLDGGVREHHALRLAGRAGRGHDERIAFLDGHAVRQGVLLPVGADDASRPECVEHDSPGGGG